MKTKPAKPALKPLLNRLITRPNEVHDIDIMAKEFGCKPDSLRGACREAKALGLKLVFDRYSIINVIPNGAGAELPEIPSLPEPKPHYIPVPPLRVAKEDLPPLGTLYEQVRVTDSGQVVLQTEEGNQFMAVLKAVVPNQRKDANAEQG